MERKKNKKGRSTKKQRKVKKNQIKIKKIRVNAELCACFALRRFSTTVELYSCINSCMNDMMLAREAFCRAAEHYSEQ